MCIQKIVQKLLVWLEMVILFCVSLECLIQVFIRINNYHFIRISVNQQTP